MALDWQAKLRVLRISGQGPNVLEKLSEKTRKEVADRDGFARRTLYRTGNFDLYSEDFRWVADYEITGTSTPGDMFFVERTEWGPFIGSIKSVDLNGKVIEKSSMSMEALDAEQTRGAGRRERIRGIESGEIAAVNHYLEEETPEAQEGRAPIRQEKSAIRRSGKRVQDQLGTT